MFNNNIIFILYLLIKNTGNYILFAIKFVFCIEKCIEIYFTSKLSTIELNSGFELPDL